MRTVNTEVIIRTIILAITLLNQTLTMLGKTHCRGPRMISMDMCALAV